MRERTNRQTNKQIDFTSSRQMALHCDVKPDERSREESWFGGQKIRDGQIERRDIAQQNEILVSNDIDPDVETRKDLDCGYAWLILITMFLLNSTLSGASRVYGVVYAKQVEINYYDREQASWPIATSSTIENLLGILTPALAQFISWRQIELVSTSLFILSNLIAYFSSTLTLDIISLGLIQGIGLSMNTVIIMALNNDYFERYRTTAYGIALSGSTFGLLYMNPLTSWILSNSSEGKGKEKEAFRNVYLAIACVCLLNYPLIALIVPRNSEEQSREKAKAKAKENEDENKNEEPYLNSIGSNNEKNNNKRKVENSPETYYRKISSCLNNYFARDDSIASIELSKFYRHDKYPTDWRRSHSTIFYLANNDSRRLNNYFEHPISAKQHLAYCTRRSVSANELDQRKKSKIGAHSMVVMNPSYISYLGSTKRIGQTSETTRIKVQPRTLVKVSSNGPKMELLSKQTVQTTSQNTEQLSKQDSSHSIERVPKKSVVSFHIDLDSNYSNTLEKSDSIRAFSTQQARVCPPGSTSGSENEEIVTFSYELIFKLLRKPCLHCVWMMLTIYYLLSRVFIMIIVDLGKDRNLEPVESSNLLNYWSFGEICGRIILASLIDLRWLSVKNCIIITCSFLSLSIFSLVLASDYLLGFYFYAFCLTIVAALVSLEYVLINVLLLDYMTSSRKSFSSNQIQIATCYSIGSFISSLLLFARPTLIGLYRDKLGSYDGLLLLLAALPIAFVALFALIEPSMRPPRLSYY